MGWVLGFWEFLFPILCSYLDGEHCRLRSGNVSLDDSNRETCCISAVLVPTWGGGGWELGPGCQFWLQPQVGDHVCTCSDFQSPREQKRKIHLGGNLSYEHSSSVGISYGFRKRSCLQEPLSTVGKHIPSMLPVLPPLQASPRSQSELRQRQDGSLKLQILWLANLSLDHWGLHKCLGSQSFQLDGVGALCFC